MRRWYLIAVVVLVGMGLGQAGESVPAIDMDASAFAWTYSQAAQANIDGFRIRCGPSASTLTLTSPLLAPAVRSYPVNQVITTPGQYTCLVQAENPFGVGTSAAIERRMGRRPEAPTGLTLIDLN